MITRVTRTTMFREWLKLGRVMRLLSNRKRWIKGTMARDKDGFQVSANGPNAVCWCLVGGGWKLDISWGQLSKMIYSEFPDEGLATFNDTTTHDHVMWLLTKMRAALFRKIIFGAQP